MGGEDGRLVGLFACLFCWSFFWMGVFCLCFFFFPQQGCLLGGFLLAQTEGVRMLLPRWNAISFSGCAPAAARCCFFGAFSITVIHLVSRTPSAFALLALFFSSSVLVTLPSPSLVTWCSLCLLQYGLTCIFCPVTPLNSAQST